MYTIIFLIYPWEEWGRLKERERERERSKTKNPYSKQVRMTITHRWLRTLDHSTFDWDIPWPLCTLDSHLDQDEYVRMRCGGPLFWMLCSQVTLWQVCFWWSLLGRIEHEYAYYIMLQYPDDQRTTKTIPATWNAHQENPEVMETHGTEDSP